MSSSISNGHIIAFAQKSYPVKITTSKLPKQTAEASTKVTISNIGSNEYRGFTNITIPGIGSGIVGVDYRPQNGNQIFSAFVSHLPGQEGGPAHSDFNYENGPILPKPLNIPGIGTGILILDLEFLHNSPNL